MNDEITQKFEDLCFHLNELTEKEREDIVEHYFKDYFNEPNERIAEALESIDKTLKKWENDRF